VNKRELGVVIARFQAPSLTDAHRYLLGQVATRVSRLLVLLGVSPVPCLKKNPLEYVLREQMLRAFWHENYPNGPELTILPIVDCPTDAEWVARVDSLISAVNINGLATIYCGPDGAGPTYRDANGLWPVEILDSMGGHASKVRENLTPRYTEDFRAGVIYGIERDYVRPRMCVDVIIRGADKVLLAHKHQDRRDDGREWRLIGGFVDVQDPNLETAVRREVLEETGLEISEPMYVGSAQVDDWRYQNGPEGIITAVFSCEKVFGEARASDDIDAVKWVSKDEAERIIHPIHEHLLALGLRRVQ
jgi:bifunctional NMN adenylyltransferase/nudix hydrolase